MSYKDLVNLRVDDFWVKYYQVHLQWPVSVFCLGGQLMEDRMEWMMMMMMNKLMLGAAHRSCYSVRMTMDEEDGKQPRQKGTPVIIFFYRDTKGEQCKWWDAWEVEWAHKSNYETKLNDGSTTLIVKP